MSILDLLRAEFERRRARNRRYSLRAFARGIRIDHATLSQILRRRRRITPVTVRRLAGFLELEADETERHCLEVALLRLVSRRAFRPDSGAIATALGVDVDRVNIILQRLLRTGALLMKSSRSWEVRDG